jgi:hypothetical protein
MTCDRKQSKIRIAKTAPFTFLSLFLIAFLKTSNRIPSCVQFQIPFKASRHTPHDFCNVS